MSKRIVISGYYGFGNTGDEAVLAGMLAAFHEALDVSIMVLSADPERTVRDHADVQAVHRWRPLDVFRAIKSADVFISGGGSLIQDVTSAMSPRYYLALLRLAQMMRRKTMVYAQGVGPLEHESTRRAVVKAFSRADAITVRDEDSRSLLESIGVKRAAQVVADPAFLVGPDTSSADAVLAERGLARGSFIGVSLRSWPGHEEWRPALCKGIGQAAAELSVRAAVIPMQEPDDAAGVDIDGAAVLSAQGDPGLAKGFISRCGLVVGMRLHSLIFAAGTATPFLPVVYDPKVASFARAAGVDASLDLESLSAERVKEAVVAAWENRQSTRDMLAARALDWREQALAPVRLLQGLLAQ
jgi:polysaccharide pyruvyl transferase CsaB